MARKEKIISSIEQVVRVGSDLLGRQSRVRELEVSAQDV
jgi:hypothetical protein